MHCCHEFVRGSYALTDIPSTYEIEAITHMLFPVDTQNLFDYNSPFYVRKQC